MAFINFMTTSLNNDGYLVADKMEELGELKTILNDNKLVIKSEVMTYFSLNFATLCIKIAEV